MKEFARSCNAATNPDRNFPNSGYIRQIPPVRLIYVLPELAREKMHSLLDRCRYTPKYDGSQQESQIDLSQLVAVALRRNRRRSGN